MLFMIVFSWQDLNMSSHWNFLTKWPSFLNHFRFKIITKRVKITLSRFWPMTSLTDWWKDLVLNGTRLLRNTDEKKRNKPQSASVTVLHVGSVLEENCLVPLVEVQPLNHPIWLYVHIRSSVQVYQPLKMRIL